MTRYIEHILQPGETVAYTTTLHWVVYLPAIGLWLLAFIALTVGGVAGPVALLAALVCALTGLDWLPGPGSGAGRPRLM